MRLDQILCRSAVQVPILLFVTGASAQTLPNGTFHETSWGAMELSCISSDLCFASYENGKSFLYFSSPGGDGKYYGYWAESGSSEPCDSDLQFPNIRTNAWGKLDLSFDYDGDYWSGLWGYCSAEPTREFSGERGGMLQTRSTQAEIKAAAAAHLLGMPYGETTADVMENIVSVSFGTDTLCSGPDNWTVEVYVRATAQSDGISGKMVIDDASATPVCTGLPFLH